MTVTATRPIIKSRTPTAASYGLMSLDDATDQVASVPYRWLIYGMPSAGKTSLGSKWPEPIFLFSPGEDGLLALARQGRIEKTKYFPKMCETAGDANLAVSELLIKDHSYKTLVIDTISGLEPLFIEDAVRDKFKGSQKEFDSFGGVQGMKSVVPEWRKFLNQLQKLRDLKQMDVVLLAHGRVKNFKNPEGLDYGRHYPAMTDQLAEITINWADAVLFAQFETLVKREGLKIFSEGGSERVLQCQRSAAWEAKNRMGLPEVILCDKGPADAYRQIREALDKRPAAVGAGSSSDDASPK